MEGSWAEKWIAPDRSGWPIVHGGRPMSEGGKKAGRGFTGARGAQAIIFWVEPPLATLLRALKGLWVLPPGGVAVKVLGSLPPATLPMWSEP